MDLSNLKSTDNVDVSGKTLLVRADLNVPVRDGAVTDTTRLERIVPGLQSWCAQGAKIVILSHFGRPKGQPNPDMSLRPIAQSLAQIIGRPVSFGADCIGAAASDTVTALQSGEICVLENLRFHAGEELNDAAFADALATLGDVYVNDAFSVSHRAHASTDALARRRPAYAGPLMMEEINALKSALEQPKRPVAAVVGGAKVSTKIPVLKNLAAKVDHLIIGGGMANTFLLAEGYSVGKSLAEPDLVDEAKRIKEAAAAQQCTIVLPEDVVVATEFAAGATHHVAEVGSVPAEEMILDVGPKSVQHVTAVLSACKTLLWNGPLGAFEIEPFGEGTFALAKAAADLTRTGQLTSVAGGGDTVAALNAAGVTGEYTYVSTAGGAFLEWLEGRELPGIVALTRES